MARPPAGDLVRAPPPCPCGHRYNGNAGWRAVRKHEERGGPKGEACPAAADLKRLQTLERIRELVAEGKGRDVVIPMSPEDAEKERLALQIAQVVQDADEEETRQRHQERMLRLQVTR